MIGYEARCVSVLFTFLGYESKATKQEEKKNRPLCRKWAEMFVPSVRCAKGSGPAIHTAVISSSSRPKVTDTYTAPAQHAQRAMAPFLTVGTKGFDRTRPRREYAYDGELTGKEHPGAGSSRRNLKRSETASKFWRRATGRYRTVCAVSFGVLCYATCNIHVPERVPKLGHSQKKKTVALKCSQLLISAKSNDAGPHSGF